jgi:hypothetical protein
MDLRQERQVNDPLRGKGMAGAMIPGSEPLLVPVPKSAYRPLTNGSRALDGQVVSSKPASVILDNFFSDRDLNVH